MKLKSFVFLLLACSASVAMNGFPMPEKNVVQMNSANWELVKSENGINLYVSSYEWLDGAMKLKLKFENTTAASVGISWTITAADQPDLNRNYSISIDANSSKEFQDEENPISIEVGQTEKDFTITFN
ncbi:MAG: hypothetical protein KDD41_08420 [Flavobacteriales bacterium]|nr:hypothetical protein [Flavobacteriales bacterium]